jgi:hypothetical protein
MADQLFDDYGIGTGSQNLFGGGMSKQELDQLLGQITPRAPIAEGLIADGTVDSGGMNLSDPFLPPKAAPPGTMWELNPNSNQYELVANPDWIPERPYSGTTPAAAPEAASASALASASLLSGQNDLFPNLKTDSQFSAPQSLAPTSVLGMFPEVEAMQRALYQQKQNEAMQAQAMQFARLSPMQQAQYSLYMGGQQLGGAIGSALGGKDPQLQMIGLQSRILSELVPGDPAQNIQIAKKYATFAPELAMKIYDNALNQNVKIKQATGNSKLNITAKVQEAERIATAEGLDGTAFETRVAELLKGTDKLSDKQAISNEVSGLKANLRVLEKQPQPNQEAIQRIKDQIQSLEPDKQNVAKIGVAKASGKAVYFDKETDQQFVYGRSPTDPAKQIRVLFEGDVDQTTSNVSATSTSKGADEGAKTIAELSAKRVDAAKVSAAKAIEQAGLLQELLKTPQPISGSGAPVRVGALRVFSTFGLTSSKDDEALGNADKFTALAGERVISFIKALGSNPTDTDREFARTIGPALEKGTKTNADLINFLLERARKVVKDADAMENHFYDNKFSLRGYKSPFLSDLETPKLKGSDKPVSQMTKQELLDEQTRLQQK